MNGKLRRRKRWFRALEIAEILFEYEAYDTACLRDLETFLEEEGMYSPKIKEDLVEKLYHKAKAENMTNDQAGESNYQGCPKRSKTCKNQKEEQRMRNRNPEIIEIRREDKAPGGIEFRCKKCAHIWWPLFAAEPGKFKPNAWNCPRGCKA